MSSPEVVVPSRLSRLWAKVRRHYLRTDSSSSQTSSASDASSDNGKAAEPVFTVLSIRRVAKIEDEDTEMQEDIDDGLSIHGSNLDLVNRSLSRTPSRAHSRAASIHTTTRAASVHTTRPASKHRHSTVSIANSTMSFSNLPYGARPHRLSWSTSDFDHWRWREGSMMGSNSPAVESPISDDNKSLASAMPAELRANANGSTPRVRRVTRTVSGPAAMHSTRNSIGEVPTPRRRNRNSVGKSNSFAHSRTIAESHELPSRPTSVCLAAA